LPRDHDGGGHDGNNANQMNMAQAESDQDEITPPSAGDLIELVLESDQPSAIQIQIIQDILQHFN
jgi:hypothetical protein